MGDSASYLWLELQGVNRWAVPLCLRLISRTPAPLTATNPPAEKTGRGVVPGTYSGQGTALRRVLVPRRRGLDACAAVAAVGGPSANLWYADVSGISAGGASMQAASLRKGRSEARKTRSQPLPPDLASTQPRIPCGLIRHRSGSRSGTRLRSTCVYPRAALGGGDRGLLRGSRIGA